MDNFQESEIKRIRELYHFRPLSWPGAIAGLVLVLLVLILWALILWALILLVLIK